MKSHIAPPQLNGLKKSFRVPKDASISLELFCQRNRFAGVLLNEDASEGLRGAQEAPWCLQIWWKGWTRRSEASLDDGEHRSTRGPRVLESA